MSDANPSFLLKFYAHSSVLYSAYNAYIRTCQLEAFGVFYLSSLLLRGEWISSKSDPIWRGEGKRSKAGEVLPVPHLRAYCA